MILFAGFMAVIGPTTLKFLLYCQVGLLILTVTLTYLKHESTWTQTYSFPRFRNLLQKSFVGWVLGSKNWFSPPVGYAASVVGIKRLQVSSRCVGHMTYSNRESTFRSGDPLIRYSKLSLNMFPCECLHPYFLKRPELCGGVFTIYSGVLLFCNTKGSSHCALALNGLNFYS